METSLPNRKWAKKLFEYTSYGLFALHLLLTLYYSLTFIPFMLAVNLACSLFCLLSLRFLKKGQIRIQLLVLYVTELLQLMICSVFVGWSAGFQLPLAGLAAMFFLGEYLSRSMKMPCLPALPLALIDLGVYVLTYPFFFHRPGLLELPFSSVLPLEIAWSTLVLAFLVWGMSMVIQLTSVSEHSLANKAETDELTGLLNRAGYDRLIDEVDIRSTALLLVDTDKFKGINDRFGHETGDLVLKKISRSLLGNFRQQDCVCRIGGDEFAILMLNIGSLDAGKIVEKIRYINLELAGTADDAFPAVSVSVGVAYGSGAKDWSELFRQADSVLYQVKQEGGRGCRIYTP